MYSPNQQPEPENFWVSLVRFRALLKTIRKEFEKMDEIKFDPSTITATIHPNAIYTSRLLNFTNLPQPVNSNKVTIIGNNNDSY